MRVRTFFCIAQAFERKFKIFIFYLLFNAAKNRILTDVRSPCATDHIDARQKIRFEEHGAVVRARCRRSYMLFRAVRRGIRLVFRFCHVGMPVLHAAGRMRVPEYTYIRISGRKYSKAYRKYPLCGAGAGDDNVFCVYGAGKRYGFGDFSSAGILCAEKLQSEKIHGFHFRDAKRRRESGRYADPVRQSSEPVSLFIL